jgi:hypothetical protein
VNTVVASTVTIVASILPVTYRLAEFEQGRRRITVATGAERKLSESPMIDMTLAFA